MPPLSKKPRAILMDVIPPDMTAATANRRLLELEALTKTYGGIVIVKLIQRRSLPDYRTYIGRGKVDELIEIGKEEGAELVIVNNLLKPKQMFELGEVLRKNGGMAVWDRVDLIIKIFQKHASSAEAKLQVKLAAIRHMGPRIFGMGMELMQQAGGTGTRGGPGETNTEIMRRHLEEQTKHIERALEKATNTRMVHRNQRRRAGFKTVSIVGYTNAGKSSLLNALTHKGAYVANELFATLDTRVAKLWISPEDGGRTRGSAPTGQAFNILLSDTIGFIQDLPPQLIKAFRSTLDETVEADLLLHVIDAADPFMKEKIDEVEEVLTELNVAHTPKIYAFNKIDAKTRIGRETLKRRYREFSPVFVSAVTGKGLEELKQEIARKLLFSERSSSEVEELP